MGLGLGPVSGQSDLLTILNQTARIGPGISLSVAILLFLLQAGSTDLGVESFKIIPAEERVGEALEWCWLEPQGFLGTF